MSEQINEAEKQSQVRPPTPGAEHKRLNMFIGKWKAEGKSYGEGQSPENPHDSAVKWASEENYEWFTGEFFLVHRFEALVGDKDFKGIEVIGYDAASQSYFTRFFDNSGNHPEYQLSVNENTWTWMGEAQRGRIVFSDDGETMTIHWDWKHDGADWLPLCDLKAVKAK